MYDKIHYKLKKKKKKETVCWKSMLEPYVVREETEKVYWGQIS